MAEGYLHLLLAPAQGAQEPVEPDLTDSLEAEPLGADVAGISMLQRVNVDAPSCLPLARLEGLADDVEPLLLDKARLVLVYPLAHHIAVAGHLVSPQLRLPLVLVLVGQTA